MTLELLEPMLHGGIRNTHFFNGRLLTADDLRAEQQANRAQHQQLGLAVGAGVVEGYDVRLSPAGNGARPVLRVSKGLAVTRKGAALALHEDVDVTLVRQPRTALLNGDAGLFAVCRPEATTPSATVAEGVYLFVVSPASGFAEHAPVVGFNGNGVASGCDHRYAVEGVRFGLVGVDLTQLELRRRRDPRRAGATAGPDQPGQPHSAAQLAGASLFRHAARPPASRLTRSACPAASRRWPATAWWTGCAAAAT